MISYLTNNEINREKWDLCIQSSVNHMPYGYSWWLDSVCASWDAIILDDYRAVLPLTHKRKLGIDYLFQPVFTQQLGIFSGMNLQQEEVDKLFLEIPPKFRFIDIQVSAGNVPSTEDYSIRFRSDFVLDLSQDYEPIYASYHRNCRRNIQKAGHSGLSLKQGPGPSVFARFVESNLRDSIENPGRDMFSILSVLCEKTIQKGMGEILGVYNSSRDLMAAGWFVHDGGRIYFLVCASSKSGKQNQAMYFLVDQVIKSNAGKNMVFDFTGSNLPGVAYFNAGFGAVKTTYPAIIKNKLPWPLKLFK